jgi:hypothetical protein
MIEALARYGRKSALASGVLMLVATVFLFAFYALEAPAILAEDADKWVPLGRTNDALIGLAALAAIPLAALLHEEWRSRAAGLSVTVFVIAVAGLVLIGIVQLVYAANLISTATQSLLTEPGWLAIGVWLIAVNAGRAHPAMRGVLAWLGVAAGVGFMAVGAAVVLLGDAVSDPEAALSNPLAIVAGLAGALTLSSIYPIWALWIWRRLSSATLWPA